MLFLPHFLGETTQLQLAGSVLKLCFLSYTGELAGHQERRLSPEPSQTATIYFIPGPDQHFTTSQSQIGMRKKREEEGYN
jgi:hypothetical protein